MRRGCAEGAPYGTGKTPGTRMNRGFQRSVPYLPFIPRSNVREGSEVLLRLPPSRLAGDARFGNFRFPHCIAPNSFSSFRLALSFNMPPLRGLGMGGNIQKYRESAG